MNRSTKKRLRWLIIVVSTGTLVVGGYFGGRYYVWPAFKARRIDRINRDGQGFLLAHDYANALLTARKSLQASSENPVAWQLASSAAAAQDLPDAVFYQDSLAREAPSKANYLSLMRLSLRFDVPDYGLTALKSVGVEGRDDPEFHRVAAALYERTGQLLAAKYELSALTRLDPADQTAALGLAKLELAEDPGRKDLSIRPRIMTLAKRPELRVKALLLLLTENVMTAHVSGTAELLDLLESSQGLDVADRLVVIRALLLLNRPDGRARELALKKESEDNPADVALILGFLIESGSARSVPAWVLTLPEKTQGDPRVEHMVAESLLKVGDSLGLITYLDRLNWLGGDYMRQAFLAHAYRDLGRSANFETAWRLAVIGASPDIHKTTTLLAWADGWRWVNERYEVVWKLFALVPTNPSVQSVLAGWERRQGNTANLNRLFARIVEVEPTNDDARNNLAYTSLLLDSNIARASLIAADLVAAKPHNPYYATTNALAYYRQGDPRKGLARLDALSAAERSLPLRMMYRGLFLAADGQVGPATDLMNGVHLEGMLPEEKKLVAVGIAAIAEVDRMNGYRSRLIAFHKGQGAESGTSGWLALVSGATRTHATADMQLSDSLFAVPDWKGLAELLNSTDWKSDDYLRSALRAFVLRHQGSTGEGREQWAQAMALADSDVTQLQNLRALSTYWNWTAERIETLNALLRQTPADHALVAELLQYYRTERRTPDLMRVLSLYTTSTPSAVDEGVMEAYYSLLLDSNEARAHVVARNAFEAAPASVERRMVYALSLWRQNSTGEAITLMAGATAAGESSQVSIPLIRAIIFAHAGRIQDARASLALFNEEAALPEEAALAHQIESELAAQDKGVKPPVT